MLVEVYDYNRGARDLIKTVSVDNEKDGMIVLRHVAHNERYCGDNYAWLTDENGTVAILNLYHAKGQAPRWNITRQNGEIVDPGDAPPSFASDGRTSDGRQVCSKHDFWRAVYEVDQDCPICRREGG